MLLVPVLTVHCGVMAVDMHYSIMTLCILSETHFLYIVCDH